MASLLLNPRVWIALAIIVAVGWVCIHIDNLEDTIAAKDVVIASMQTELDKVKVADKSKEISLAACTGNVDQIKQAYQEMQAIAAKSSVYKKKWAQVTAEQAELPPPKDDEPCLNGGQIDAGHKAILSAVVGDLNAYYSVRRKISRPDSNGNGAGTPKVLPPATSPGRL
jgi:hypothetical protein